MRFYYIINIGRGDSLSPNNGFYPKIREIDMILTICPNPSIDCTIEVDSLNIGKLNRIRNKLITYAGKTLNVAKAVARLGKQSLATGFMFGDQARLFEQTLEREGINYKFVSCEGSCRVNYKIIDNKSMLTEINDIGTPVSRAKQLELINLVKEISKKCDMVVMSGSLPGGVSPEFYGEVLSAVSKNADIIVDTERTNMLSALRREIFMVKPNLHELEQFSGQVIYTKQDVINAAGKYIDFGVKYVLASMGAEGAILTDGVNSYYCKSASVAVNSTVGAGDCMVAAVCVCKENNESVEEMLKCAVAAGTASITTSGTNLFYKDKYEEIYSKIHVERL